MSRGPSHDCVIMCVCANFENVFFATHFNDARSEVFLKSRRVITLPEQLLSTTYVPDNPWLASSHTTSRDQGQVGANSSRKYSSSSPRRHHTGLSELRGKKQQQPTTYNLAWRDAHARTTHESHLARAMRDPRRVLRAPFHAHAQRSQQARATQLPKLL